jgi:hypothetical protein
MANDRERPTQTAPPDSRAGLTPQPSNVDAIDVLFGLLPAGMTMIVMVLWGRLLARSIRGDAPRTIPLGTSVASGLAIASWSFVSGTRVRWNVALRQSIVVLRTLGQEQAEEATLRDRRDIARDERDHARNDQLFRINIGLLILAALTLAAAIVTLVVSLQ